MTDGPRVNFVMREALFEIYTWILCLSYHPFIYTYQNCPALVVKYPFLIHNRAVFRTATGTASSYVTGTVSWKFDVKIFLIFIAVENTGSVNIFT